MENENEETHGNPAGNPAETQEPTNGVSTPEELEAIRAQLEEEQAALAEARAQLEQTMSEKDARIVALEAQLSQAQQAAESLRAEGVAISEANAQAIAKYLDAVKAANPAIPPDIIAGATIEEIDASVEKAQSIATAVKASLEAQAKETRVPAGAPARENINVEGLSPREKIVVGIQQKQGGTS
jgi:predicted ribosome quality control (RQC) complex YloA/Tae2 family protein